MAVIVTVIDALIGESRLGLLLMERVQGQLTVRLSRRTIGQESGRKGLIHDAYVRVVGRVCERAKKKKKREE